MEVWKHIRELEEQQSQAKSKLDRSTVKKAIKLLQDAGECKYVEQYNLNTLHVQHMDKRNEALPR